MAPRLMPVASARAVLVILRSRSLRLSMAANCRLSDSSGLETLIGDQ